MIKGFEGNYKKGTVKSIRVCDICGEPIRDSFDRIAVEQWRKGSDGYFHIEFETKTDVCDRHFLKLKDAVKLKKPIKMKTIAPHVIKKSKKK